jgi:hypothetical protein
LSERSERRIRKMVNNVVKKSKYKNTIPLFLPSDKKNEKSGDVAILRRV